jgi:hypothetical protein
MDFRRLGPHRHSELEDQCSFAVTTHAVMDPIIKKPYMKIRVYGKTEALRPIVLIARNAGAATRVG